jgi:hypothetical protein
MATADLCSAIATCVPSSMDGEITAARATRPSIRGRWKTYESARSSRTAAAVSSAARTAAARANPIRTARTGCPPRNAFIRRATASGCAQGCSPTSPYGPLAIGPPLSPRRRRPGSPRRLLPHLPFPLLRLLLPPFLRGSDAHPATANR